MAHAVVHIVHRDPGVRDELARILGPGGYHVRTWPDAALMPEIEPGGGPVCILLGFDASAPDTLASLEMLHARGPQIGTVALADHGDAQTVVETLRRGACNFIEFPIPDDLLLDIVRDVFDRLHSQSLVERSRSNAKAQIARLSPREMEVYLGIVQGNQNKVIAKELGISPRTVEVYRANIMEKLGSHNLAALLKCAFLAGLLDDAGAGGPDFAGSASPSADNGAPVPTGDRIMRRPAEDTARRAS